MFAKPEKILKQFGIEENMILADLGAGSGFYTLALAHMVPKGKVYAVEIQKDFLTTIRNKIKEAHLENVECLWGDVESIEGTKIRSHLVDRVVISNVLFQIIQKDTFLSEVKRILKKDGKVLIIDWHDTDSPLAPKGINLIKEEKCKALTEASGFTYERSVDAGEHHYGMIFRVK